MTVTITDMMMMMILDWARQFSQQRSQEAASRHPADSQQGSQQEASWAASKQPAGSSQQAAGNQQQPASLMSITIGKVPDPWKFTPEVEEITPEYGEDAFLVEASRIFFFFFSVLGCPASSPRPVASCPRPVASRPGSLPW